MSETMDIGWLVDTTLFEGGPEGLLDTALIHGALGHITIRPPWK
jgi:hypothetical protein